MTIGTQQVSPAQNLHFPTAETTDQQNKLTFLNLSFIWTYKQGTRGRKEPRDTSLPHGPTEDLGGMVYFLSSSSKRKNKCIWGSIHSIVLCALDMCPDLLASLASQCDSRSFSVCYTQLCLLNKTQQLKTGRGLCCILIQLSLHRDSVQNNDISWLDPGAQGWKQVRYIWPWRFASL